MRGKLNQEMRSSYNAVMTLALLILLATSSPADAKTKAVVSGVVTDITGAVVPGTEITFTNERTKKKVVVTASEVGRYEVKLPPGVYSLSTEKHAFCSFRRAGVRFKRTANGPYSLVASGRREPDRSCVGCGHRR
jgi:hypothetical protein